MSLDKEYCDILDEAYSLGKYEVETSQSIRHLISHKNQSVFVDIGASLGYYTKLIASIMNNGNIFAFEPDAARFEILKRRATEWAKMYECYIRTYEIALSNFNGATDFFTNYTNFSGSLEKDGNPCFVFKDTEKAKVEVRKLDTVLKDLKIDVIKIDVEGSEFDVLKGAIDIIKRDKPVLYIEFHNSDRPKIIDWLGEHGYEFSSPLRCFI